MAKSLYHGAPVAIREDLATAHRAIWDALARPGTWWTSAQRSGLARAARRGRSDKGLAPEPTAGPEPTLPEGAVEVARRVGGDPASITRAWFDGVVPSRLSDAEYVETAAIAIQTTSVDMFCRALGVPFHDHPEPGPGEPSRARPETAIAEEAWVATVPNGRRGGAEAERLYGGAMMPNVIRALSLVPADCTLANAQAEAQYMGVTEVMDPGFEPGRGLDRAQIELVAGRVSAINECFY